MKAAYITGAALAAALHVSGCATVKETATAKETFVACRAVDTATTIAILQRGGMEKNPIMAKVYSASPLAFIAFQIAVALYVSSHWDEYGDGTKIALNAVSCAPALHNAGQL